MTQQNVHHTIKSRVWFVSPLSLPLGPVIAAANIIFENQKQNFSLAQHIIIITCGAPSSHTATSVADSWLHMRIKYCCVQRRQLYVKQRTYVGWAHIYIHIVMVQIHHQHLLHAPSTGDAPTLCCEFLSATLSSAQMWWVAVHQTCIAVRLKFWAPTDHNH